MAIGNIGKRRDAGAGGHAGNADAASCCDANQKPRSHDTSRTSLSEPLEPPPISPARGPPTDSGKLVQALF